MKIFTVSELNNLAKQLLEGSFTEILLDGEISNFKKHSSGHLYFSLKDALSQINAVMYRYKASSLKFKPADGMEVRVKGTVSIYPVRGSYQIVVSEMSEKGLGGLQKKFEELKKKLEAEGLMAAERKRQIPILARKIGVVTSPTGAAIRDILRIIKRRFSNIHLILYPVRVQGEEAKYEISKAINDFNEYFPDVDVLIVGRGGGSLEDLFAFNEEIVARAIFASKIPVISAVGHEIDVTISDLVADLRAATPSEAAELVVKKKEDLVNLIDTYSKRMAAIVERLWRNAEERLNALCRRPFFVNPELFLAPFEQGLDEVLEEFTSVKETYFDEAEEKLSTLFESLEMLSPENVLRRGYSVVMKNSGSAVKNWREVSEGESLNVRLWKGFLGVEVKERMGK